MSVLTLVESGYGSVQQMTIRNLQKLGHYRVLQEVGSGGLGKVFKGIDERTGRTVAIKLLHDRYMNNRKFLGIFHRELLIISGLHHKHIVDYIDSCFEPPQCYIVTEFIEGWSLHAFMKRTGKLPPLVALCVIIDMMQGIDHLHLHDTIHSDLSAPNVLIEKTGRVLVTDFGLACQRDVEDYKNYMIGTPGYYSPEHISEAPIVPPTDIYCAGLLLYELLTGMKAVPALNDRHKLLALMKNINYSFVACTDRKMETMLRKLLKSCLNPKVSSRLPSAEVMMFEIYKILRRYGIRYARHAIKQFLVDRKLVEGSPVTADQNIYLGQAS